MSQSEEFSTDPSDYSDIEPLPPTKPSITLSNQCNTSSSTYTKSQCIDPITSKQEPITTHTEFESPIISLQKAKDSKKEQESDIESDINMNTYSDTESDESEHYTEAKTRRRMELEKQSLDFLLAQCMSLHQTLRWNITNEWCRYCGARASIAFLKSPWGHKQLCFKHHTQWTEKELDLSSFEEPNDIQHIINSCQCTEKEYLIDLLMKYNPSDGAKRRSLRIKTKNSNSKMIGDDDYDFSELSDIPPPSDSQKSIESESWHSAHSQSDKSDGIDDDDDDALMQNVDKMKKPGNHQKYKEWECKDCHKVLISTTSFKFHCDEEHDNERPFWCRQCPKTYRNAGGLSVHTRKIHEGEINHHCKYCNRGFFDKTEWKNHLKRHMKKIKEEEKPMNFECPQCDRVFKYRYYLKRHIINMHTDNEDKPYQCQYCTYGGATKKQILWHENIHRNERQYKCTGCDKSFNNKKDLQHHTLNVHTRPFKCIECGRGFGTKKYMEMHMIQIHAASEDKPYQCRYCDYGSVLKKTVEKHEGKHIKKEKKETPFKCGQCGERFELLNDLHSHITNIHSTRASSSSGHRSDRKEHKYRAMSSDKDHKRKHKKRRKHKKKERKHRKKKEKKKKQKEHRDHKEKGNNLLDIMRLPMPKQPKDVHRPKKPLNAFFLFGREMREAIKAQYPDAKLKQAEVAREIGKRWNAMSEAEKLKYRMQEKKHFDEFKLVIDSYQKSNEYKMFQNKLREWQQECNRRRMENFNRMKPSVVGDDSSSPERGSATYTEASDEYQSSYS